MNQWMSQVEHTEMLWFKVLSLIIGHDTFPTNASISWNIGDTDILPYDIVMW